MRAACIGDLEKHNLAMVDWLGLSQFQVVTLTLPKNIAHIKSGRNSHLNNSFPTFANV